MYDDVGMDGLTLVLITVLAVGLATALAEAKAAVERLAREQHLG